MALGLLAMREGFGKDGAWVWAWPEATEAQQEQDEPQSGLPSESDPPEQARAPSAKAAASVTSPPVAPAQLQDGAQRPAIAASAVV
jgi:hypothetical protein